MKFVSPVSCTRLTILALSALFFPSLANAQGVDRELYRFDLNTAGNICDASNATTSCVRYNGDSAFYPIGTQLDVIANFPAQVGNLVPLTFPNFFFPDVQQAFDLIEVDATGEISGPAPTGVWNLATGVVTMDAGPVDFPNVTQGGAVVDPFDVDAQPLPGTLVCGGEFVPNMLGLPLPGPVGAPGNMTMVGRACVTGPSLTETFFAILRGNLVFVPEPTSGALAGTVLLTLMILARGGAKERL